MICSTLIHGTFNHLPISFNHFLRSEQRSGHRRDEEIPTHEFSYRDLPQVQSQTQTKSNVSWISSMMKIPNFILTKLTGLLLEVPTRHWSCGKFVVGDFIFTNVPKIRENFIPWIKEWPWVWYMYRPCTTTKA